MTEKDNGDGTTTVSRTCPFCHKPAGVTLKTAAWKLWDNGNGPFIQDIAPELTPGEREILITGTHDDCWDLAFPPASDDE